MKWTNRGHQLDDIGKKYLKIEHLYIWGAGHNGAKIIEDLRWLGVDRDFDIKFVDSSEDKWGCSHCGFAVISPENFSTVYDSENSILVASNSEIDHMLKDNHLLYFRYITDSHNEYFLNDFFIKDFLCIYMMYKHNKFLVHFMDWISTTVCNLNCENCLNFTPYIKKQQHFSFNDFKSDIDTLFKKVDYIYSFHFSGGDCFLNKQFPDMLLYLSEKYSQRIHDLFCITNGTIVPAVDLLTSLKRSGCRVHIDDYRETVPLATINMPILLDKLCEHSISYIVTPVDEWVNLCFFDTSNVHLTETHLIKWKDDCNTSLCGYQSGKFYSCCYELFARNAGLLSDIDCLDLVENSKMELLEYRRGYTNTGYVNMCKHCRGLGKNYMPAKVGVQVKK
jgi:hypothetical protein